MPAAGGMGLRQEEKTNKLSLIHEQQINEIHEVVGWGCCLCCRRRLWALAAPWAPPKGRQANPNNQQQMNGIEGSKGSAPHIQTNFTSSLVCLIDGIKKYYNNT